MPPLFGGRAQRQAQILAGPHNATKALAQQQQGGLSGTIPGTSSSTQQIAVRTGVIQPYPASSPKVAGVGHQVLNNAGNPAVVMGNLACTPDPTATPPPAVPSFQDGGFAFVDASGVAIAGYSQLAGLWGFGAGGGGGGGITLGNYSTDSIAADNFTTCTGSRTIVPLTLASPPSWLDSSGDILDPGVYGAALHIIVLSAGGFAICGSPFNSGFVVPLDSLLVGTGLGASICSASDVQGLDSSDVAWSAGWSVNIRGGGSVSALPLITRLAY